MRLDKAMLVAAAVVVAALGGCTKKAEPAAPPQAAAAPKPPTASVEEVWTGAELVFLTEKFGELTATPSGLRYKVVEPGQGEARPNRANLCTVGYRGTFLDGRTFDQKKSFRFRVGTGSVIKGWDEAVADMHKGEKRLVVIPYWLGYGVTGKIPLIMPRTTLVFEIELLDWESTAKIPSAPLN